MTNNNHRNYCKLFTGNELAASNNPRIRLVDYQLLWHLFRMATNQKSLNFIRNNLPITSTEGANFGDTSR